MINDCLENIRVLDLSQYIPGPFATLTLADMGAEVIKIEPPFGDPMREVFMKGEGGISPLYKQLNAGKTIVKIDLKSGDGKKALCKLVQSADVLLESFRPGVMGRLGFSSDALKELNPKLIHCALSGYGQNGPNAQTAGHDMTYLALTGALSHSSQSDTGPVPVFPPLADHSGAMQAVNSILAALFRRERTGKGAFIDVSLFESALSWNYLGLTDAADEEKSGCALEELSGESAAWYAIYETKDARHLAFAPIEPKFWQNFCHAIEREDLLARQNDPQPQTELMIELRDLFKQKTLAQWAEILLPADCCMEPIHRPAEVLNHPHVKARQIAFANEIRYPAWVDHQPPAPRKSMQEVSLKTLLGSL